MIPTQIAIYNQLGERVYAGSLTVGQNKLDLSYLSNGFYFLTSINKRSVINIRFVKTE
jgi:hypothetical protein